MPDEVRQFGSGRLELVKLNDVTVGKATLEPGWRWSRDVKPIVDTPSCMSAHTQYVISGRLMVRMDDGEEFELAAGDAAVIPAGHDAWVVGDEPCVLVDFTGMAVYAQTPADIPEDID
jgi:hypothetical protein